MADIYRKIYRKDVRAVGADAAYLLAEITAYADFCKNNDLMDKDGYFELSAPKIEEMTGYSRHQQRHILNKLITSGIIEKKAGGNTRFLKILFLPSARETRTESAQDAHRVSARRAPSERETRTPLYNDKLSDKNMISYSQEQQNIFDLVDSYFHELGYPNESREFLKYNRQEYGEDHITPDNYKKFVKRWIKRKNNPPKKIRESGRGKTAREVAEDRGVTVDELFKTTGPPEATTGEPEKMDPFITELFGG